MTHWPNAPGAVGDRILTGLKVVGIAALVCASIVSVCSQVARAVGAV